MAQLSDDCFAFGGELMSGSEALGLIEARTVALPDAETIPLARARDRILSEPVVAARSVPPHDNAAVDGYAVFFDDLVPGAETVLAVEGRATAGHPLARPARRGAGAARCPGPRIAQGAEHICAG